MAGSLDWTSPFPDNFASCTPEVRHKLHPLSFPSRCRCGAFAKPIREDGDIKSGRCPACEMEARFQEIASRF